MIPLEKLRQVKTVVVHANCPDGLASAIIIDDVLPGREFVFAVYDVTPLEATPNMLFCDFCPPRDRADEFRRAGTIVLDHHKTMRDVVEGFEHHVFADEKTEPGVSGAVLAYRHVWRPMADEIRSPDLQPTVVEDFARLAGIRDTWQRQDDDWERACSQAATLFFYPVDYWLNNLWPQMLRASNLEMFVERMRVGEVVSRKTMDEAQGLAERAYYFKTSGRGTSVAIVPARRVSDAADLVRHDVQLLVGLDYTFEHGQIKLLLSTRARNGYDATKFCAFYGGGGHTSAAGCQRDVLAGDVNPYAMVRYMIEAYEATL